MTVKLHQGDCLDVLKRLPAGSVDAVVTDPPYGQTNEGYDSPVAFDPALWRECYRIAKPDSAIVSFAGSPTYHRIASAIEAGGWRVRQMWGWIYRDGLITSAWPKEGFDRLAPAMDPICYATKGKVLLDLQREGHAWSKTDKSGWSRKRIGWSDRTGDRYSMKADGRFPRAIVSDGVPPFEYFDMARGGRKPDSRTGHPNQKPLALMDWIVSKLPASTILDPFMGSGTTGVVCIMTSRNFIGIELDPQYFAVAERRIADAEKAASLSA